MDGDFRLGQWLVRPSLNTVSHNGASFRVEPKVMAVLMCLAHHPGEPVPKEQLLKTVWADTFVTDDVLTRSISELRRVFEDDAKDSRFIQTIPRRGYRLVAPVVLVNGASGQATTAPVTVGGGYLHSRRTVFLALLIVVPLLVAGLTLWNVPDLRRWLSQRTSTPPIHSLAVLPLKNLSDDPSQNYFAYGMAEELIANLSQIRMLKVVSHTSVLQYEKTDKLVPQIARELGVDAVIEGSVQRSADRVRITAQLIYAPKDANLWARTYDRDLSDVLALQSTVAKEIAEEIRVQMSPGESSHLARSRVVNPQALQAYWKGQYYLSSLRENSYAKDIGRATQEEEFRQASAYFDEAIRLDPNYAPAYLGYWQAHTFFQDDVDPSSSPATALAKGRAALTKALALDDTLPNAHLALGDAFFYRDWNWAGAEREYRRALELDPNSAEAHCSYANFLNSMGRLEEGLKEQEIQLQLNPDLDCDLFSPLVPLEAHIERARRYIDTHHATNEHYWDLALLLWKAGRYKEAINVWQEWMTRLGYTEVAQAIGKGYARDGYSGALREWAKAGEAAAKQRNVSCIMMVDVYGVLGDHDRAFAWLEKAFARRESSLQSLKVFLAWDPIRSDPRFAEMVRRVGLPQ